MYLCFELLAKQDISKTKKIYILFRNFSNL